MSEIVMGNKHIVALRLGDPHGDGHGHEVIFYIVSNLSAFEIEEAYKKASATMKLDFCEDVARDYEERRIFPEALAKLRAAGFDREFDNTDSDTESFDAIELELEEFRDIYLFMIKQAEPTFEYSHYMLPTVDIGGYGLF